MKTGGVIYQYKYRSLSLDTERVSNVSCREATLGRFHTAIRFFLFIISFCSLPLFSASPKTDYADHTFVFQAFVESPEIKIIENIITEAYRRAGYKVRFVYIKHADSCVSSKLLKRGVYDGELARIDGMDEEHPELVKVYSPVSWTEPVVVSKKYISTRYGWYSIRQKRVGILVYSVFSNIVTIGSKRVIAKSIDELMGLLLADKVDVIVLPALTAELYVKKYHDASIMIISPSLEYILIYHYLNKKYAPLADKLSKIIRNMLYDGTLTKIREQTLKNIFLEKGNAK